jgi:hypothetical protein
MGGQTQKLEFDITRATTVGQAIASPTVGIPVSVEFVVEGPMVRFRGAAAWMLRP